MGILEQLRSRGRLVAELAALDFQEDLPAILALYDHGELLRAENIALLEQCRAKWRGGERMHRSDLAGASVDHMLLIKVLCVFLADMIRDRHAELGLPAAVTDETCRGIGGGMFRALAEYPDELVHKLSWTDRYCRETMFKAGLFVYRMAPISERLPVLALRGRTGGRTVALAGAGVEVNSVGLICQPGQAPVFSTTLRRTAAAITGNHITPDGRIIARRVTLPLDEYEIFLEPSTVTAEMHIPPGRSMVSADCGASMRDAARIIQNHLAQFNARCFTCQSWVFSPEWLALLPESNMAQVMREVYLFPIKSTPTAGVNFVFRKSAEELDLKTAPRKTRLQRIMLERLEQREPLYAGGMFMLFEDVAKYGTRSYQRNMA